MASNKYNPFGKPSAETKVGVYSEASIGASKTREANKKAASAWDEHQRRRTKAPYLLGKGPQSVYPKSPVWNAGGSPTNKPKGK